VLASFPALFYGVVDDFFDPACQALKNDADWRSI
jgi:hypothetical protein